ncbi:MAG: aconitate hydratase AcnA [Bacteroidetes bacterium]|nr:aconitate hydratase AcnA [Bacteroidota bacterium]
MAPVHNPFGARQEYSWGDRSYVVYSLPELDRQGLIRLDRLPYSIRILLENLLRHYDEYVVTSADIEALAAWASGKLPEREIPFLPSRVILQDFTGVPAVVDLAAMRDAYRRLGGDPKRINPVVPVDLVIDHSVQVDFFGSEFALFYNAEKEFERNRERYQFLKWAQRAFENFRVVPPATGIVHQVNLEYLAKVVQFSPDALGWTLAYPDTLVGTDSHTTMINGLGVLGWGVGGIEAEANMLGQPLYMLIPEVVGFRLYGELPEGATATDLVLTITQMLRKKGVVGKFVEFFGPGVSKLSLPDRATIANMAPEYGATIGFFPVDDETLRYLLGTGRDPDFVQQVEWYCKTNGLFRTDAAPEPDFSDTLELDMSTVEPSLAGPKRPQDRLPLREVKQNFFFSLKAPLTERGFGLSEQDWDRSVTVHLDGESVQLTHGSVVIAAITSCTNTSNPSVMIGAGLLAKKAVQRGLDVKPWVKTSLAPGSRVVTEYLRHSGLMPYLEALRFHVVGYGCTTCIGNSGPLPEPIAQAIREGELVVAAVLSGNRNFEGRINPLVKANYLASPPLVIAYALAGRIDIDLLEEPLGYDPNGQPVYLRDIWPSQEEIADVIARSLRPELFEQQYARVFEGDANWQALPTPEGELYTWDPASTYIRRPPFFEDLTLELPSLSEIRGARVLMLLGDSITTDHISPAGSIPANSPAGRYLIAHGVSPEEFNSYGARRGNHEVMMRGTFANIRIKNLLLGGREGGYTIYFPTGEELPVYEAAMRYKAAGVPLVVLAGKEYGAGSSRDWAAKGTFLLGVKAVIAESYERIHRSNLVGMGVLPLEFKPGQSWRSLGLTGRELFDIEGITDPKPRQDVLVRARREDGSEITFWTTSRIDTQVEADYYRNGGILQTVLRKMIRAEITT